VTQKAQLIVTSEGRSEQVLELGERLTIGRSSSNDLVLDDQNASRRHAEIRHHGGPRYRLTDVGSANGTWLNGRRLTVPKDLEDGDRVVIGNVRMRFVAPEMIAGEGDPESTSGSITGAGVFATALAMRNETVVILVSDLRNYTGMSEVLPKREFSRVISDWFREASEVVETHGGTIDKFIGDAVMAYWSVGNPADPSAEINASLRAARDMIERTSVFSQRISSQVPGQTFRIGVGINIGEAMFGNLGTSEVQAFTIVGDSVNVAFRLEALTKEKGVMVIASRAVTEHAGGGFRFVDLGEAEVKGRREPVSICSLDLDEDTRF
jgi:adenylate cyclase